MTIHDFTKFYEYLFNNYNYINFARVFSNYKIDFYKTRKPAEKQAKNSKYYFLSNFSWDYTTVNWDCLRKDNLNLIDEFLKKPELPEFKGTKAKVVENRGELNAINVDEVDYLLGNFYSFHFWG